MTEFFDVIIVGSGPSGVSAAYPLVEAGLKVLMVDGGKTATLSPPNTDFYDWRFSDKNQSKRWLAQEFSYLSHDGALSPKLKIPSQQYVFDDFQSFNKIQSQNFLSIGSLSVGGLSNAWGCGVACFDESELSSFPFDLSELQNSYDDVVRRIGISGSADDDMASYMGLMNSLQNPVELNSITTHLLSSYNAKRDVLNKQDFRLGRARLAVLTEDFNNRYGCNSSGNCLWGCDRMSLYSSAYDLSELLVHSNFSYKKGFIVDEIGSNDNSTFIHGLDQVDNKRLKFAAKKLCLAAGTLATTRLVMNALNFREKLKLLSCPTAAFLLFSPKFIGSKPEQSFGLAHLIFNFKTKINDSIYGGIFPSGGIPYIEIIKRMPLTTRSRIDTVAFLLGSSILGNLFLPGKYGVAEVSIKKDGILKVESCDDLLIKRKDAYKDCRDMIVKNFHKLGFYLLPGSFSLGHSGSDIHYSGTLPMKKKPKISETSAEGEVSGLRGVYVVDGACLTDLPAKPHTLTLMANADRIAKCLLKLL